MSGSTIFSVGTSFARVGAPNPKRWASRARSNFALSSLKSSVLPARRARTAAAANSFMS